LLDAYGTAPLKAGMDAPKIAASQRDYAHTHVSAQADENQLKK